VEARYDTVVTADLFAEAKNTFNCLIGQLADPATATWTHDRLEEVIVEQGRELQRRLLQAHLDLRAVRERQAALAHRRAGNGSPAWTVWCDAGWRVDTGGCWPRCSGR
jgi:hypothetical protein